MSEIACKNNTKKLTAKSYIQDGLVFQVDAIENMGYGKHEAGTKFIDLISGQVFDFETATVEQSRIVLSDGKQYAKQVTKAYDALKSGKFTFERNSSGDAGLFYDRVANWGFFTIGLRPDSFDVSVGLVRKVLGLHSSPHTQCTSVSCNKTTAIATFFDHSQDIDFTESDHLSFSNMNTTGMYFYPSEIHYIRWYNRALSMEELEYNNKIDRKRFGI